MEAKTTCIWLDCDPGHDDAMAIILAGHNKNLKLLGISTVHGNQSLEKTTANALKMINISGLNHLNVYKGASYIILNQIVFFRGAFVEGDTGLDGSEIPIPTKQPIIEEALYKVFKEIKSCESKVTFIGTAVNTNIALLLKTFPEIKENIEKIVLMGGSINQGNSTPQAEYNIYLDPEASKIVFSSGIPVVIVPLEVTHTVLVTPEILEEIKGLNSKFSKVIVELLLFFAKSYKQFYNFENPPLHVNQIVFYNNFGKKDPCAVAYVINPEIFEGFAANLQVETNSEFCNGRLIIDHFVMKFNSLPKNSFITNKINQKAFWELMIQAIKEADKVSILNK